MSRDIVDLNKEIERIVAERRSRLRRYVRAKQHRTKLKGVAKKLDEARGNYLASRSAKSGLAHIDERCVRPL